MQRTSSTNTSLNWAMCLVTKIEQNMLQVDTNDFFPLGHSKH